MLTHPLLPSVANRIFWKALRTQLAWTKPQLNTDSPTVRMADLSTELTDPTLCAPSPPSRHTPGQVKVCRRLLLEARRPLRAPSSPQSRDPLICSSLTGTHRLPLLRPRHRVPSWEPSTARGQAGVTPLSSISQLVSSSRQTA